MNEYNGIIHPAIEKILPLWWDPDHEFDLGDSENGLLIEKSRVKYKPTQKRSRAINND